MTSSLVHQKPGRTFNRKQSSALRPEEVGAVWPATVDFKEILEHEEDSTRLKRIASCANIWTGVDGKPQVVLSQLIWYWFWVQLWKDWYWIQALKNLKVVYFMPVSIVLWKIGFAKLMLHWFLMELQASLIKMLVLIQYREFPIRHKVWLQDFLIKIVSTPQSSVAFLQLTTIRELIEHRIDVNEELWWNGAVSGDVLPGTALDQFLSLG